MEKTAEEIAAEKAAEARTAAPAVETRSAEAILAERTRDLIAFGTALGEPELARTMVTASADVTADDIREAVKAKQKPSTLVPVMQPGDVAREQGGVQLARSVSRVQLKAFTGEGAHERAYRSGMHLAAVLLRDEQAIQYCREHGISMSRAQGEGSNTAGGFTVIPEFDQTLFQLIIQYGVLRPNADVVPMISDQKNVTRRTGGLTAYPVGNGQRGTYSQTADDQFELIARKWMVLAKYEDELGEDSFINWADRLANEAGIALAYAEDNAGFNGDGSSTYHGIVGLLTKLTAATAGLATAAGSTYASVTLANMTSVIGLLPQFARKSGNVKWYCSSTVWANVLERIALAANGTAYQDIKGELTPVFAGKPVEIVEVMPTTAATGQICIAYGNMSQAVTFGDRRGITVKMTDSNDVDFESDLHAVKVTERFDINVHDVGDTTVAGPLVALKLA